MKTYSNDYITIHNEWRSGYDLYIYSQLTSDGYDIFVMSEGEFINNMEEDLFYYQEGLVEVFMSDFYDNIRNGCGSIYVDDEELTDVLVGEIEEWEREWLEDNPDHDEPDPDAEYDRMKDEGLLNR
jgi:hypothetical protein